MQYVIKVVISAVLIVLISEIGKRNALWSSILASLPLISVLSFIWMYVDTHDTQAIASLSTGVFWMVLPSLVLFLTLPILLHKGVDFWFSLALASGATVVSYFFMMKIMSVFKIL